MKSELPIYVTKPTLPPLDDFVEYLRKIWDSKIITNMGPFHKQFEDALANYLGVKYISLFTNGTIALITALQALEMQGEVITTPFSFVATTHSLWWNNIKPVFVDIEPEYFNLDPEKIEAAITPRTSAIMPVHVYGNPCKVDQIDQIANKYGLKVIYDAAHAFGVTVNGKSVLSFGELSVLSFHATKAFNTIEGGAIICHDQEMKERIDFLKNFGFANEIDIVTPGINGKMNEIQAAYGLLQLNYVDGYLAKRKMIAELYRQTLSEISGITFFQNMRNVNHSYTYFPILIDKYKFGQSRDEVYEKLKRFNIFTRRYFYPLISNLKPYCELPSSDPKKLPVATRISERVLCLPIFPDLEHKDVLRIVEIISTAKV